MGCGMEIGFGGASDGFLPFHIFFSVRSGLRKGWLLASYLMVCFLSNSVRLGLGGRSV